jgi:HlyD family secretion protein
MSDPAAPPSASSDYKPIAYTGYGLIALFFGILGGWAATARLDSAVLAQASVSLESRRQMVQHLEGGILREIVVREGDKVQDGQVLFRLDGTQARANREVVQTQLDLLRAQEARLVAERDRTEVRFPDDLARRQDRPNVAQVLADQMSQYRERRASIEAQVAILKSRQTTLAREIDGLNAEQASARQQLFFIDDELGGVRTLVAQALAPKTRLSSLEREKARLEGVIGRNAVDIAKAENNINEVLLQIVQLEQKVQEEVASQLLETRQRIAESEERSRVAEDALRRLEVTAPKGGLVQNVRATTVGQVLRPGDLLLELVPIDDQLLVEAQIQPVDADKVAAGLVAEVRFPSFHMRTTPLIMGRVRNVSRDRLMDEATRQPYFLAQISINDTDLPPDLKERLRAGLPAEVVIPTGERTVLQYMVQPLQDAFRRTFRET